MIQDCTLKISAKTMLDISLNAIFLCHLGFLFFVFWDCSQTIFVDSNPVMMHLHPVYQKLEFS